MADRSNPNNVGSPISEYAGFKAPKRADQSTVGGPGGYYSGDQMGNVVDPSRINKTLDNVSTQASAAKPGGVSSGSGY